MKTSMNTKNTKKPTKTVTVYKNEWYALRQRKGRGLYLFHPASLHFLEDPACAYRFKTRQEAEAIIGATGLTPKRLEIVRIAVTERKTMTITESKRSSKR